MKQFSQVYCNEVRTSLKVSLVLIKPIEEVCGNGQ